ncbi:InlB B-repeat-containing protein [Mycoplasma phocimorsus]|uniref:InlB B-repeat-containing protein n=1 Tax=Mycoplasma phocimorsus TaxID=3045839 RepID=UPI0024C07E0C|nr:InlB B-repeat-containing protein [Mycoplasma phocimorsus]MDJ1646747.1 InlB B-repeat-containing protein [Mycoplasma phocimorsus]
MKLKKIILSLLGIGAVGIPSAAISCSYVDDFIQNNIVFNTADITAYDALGEFETGQSLKIVNINDFSDKGVYITLKSKVFDFEDEALLIEAIFYTKDDPTFRGKTYFSIPFFEFKEIEESDWKRIFKGIAKETQLIWKGNGEVLAANRFGIIPEVEVSDNVKGVPTIDQVKYRLILDKSGIVTGHTKDRESEEFISGGTIIDKSESIITVTIVLPDGTTKEQRLVQVQLDDKSYGGLFPKPNFIPTKEDYEFIGWSTNKHAVKPNIFLNSKYTHTTIKSDISIYPVFAKLPTFVVDGSYFTNIKASNELILSKKRKVTKKQIEEFVEKNIPEPKERWRIAENEEYFVEDEHKQQIKLIFNENGELSNQFEIGKIYNLIPLFSHDPIYIFKDAKTDEILDKKWIEITAQGSQTPLAPTGFKEKEEKGLYLSSIKYKDDDNPYKGGFLVSDDIDNEIIEVLVDFEQTKKLTISNEYLDTGLLESPYVYLTPEGKLKEQFLPKNVDYKLFNLSKLSEFSAYRLFPQFLPDPNGKYMRFLPNNKVFDKRSDEEISAGIEFDGWYTDPKFKEKIYFENGISTKAIKSNMLYPRFKSNPWDIVRDTREIINNILNFSLPILSILDNFDTIGGNETYINVKSLLLPFKDILYISLGGVLTYDQISFNYNEISNKNAPGLIPSSALAFIKALILILKTTNLNEWFNESTKIELEKLLVPAITQLILKLLVLNKKVVDSQGVIIDINSIELPKGDDLVEDFTSLVGGAKDSLIKLLTKALNKKEEQKEQQEEKELEKDENVESMVNALINEEDGIIFLIINYVSDFLKFNFSKEKLKTTVPFAIKETIKTGSSIAEKILEFKKAVEAKLKTNENKEKK